MNLNLLGVTLFVAASVLMYAAVKNKDPRDVVLEALGQKARFKSTTPETTTPKNEANPAVPPGTTWTSV